jgi:hypothetical protein
MKISLWHCIMRHFVLSGQEYAVTNRMRASSILYSVAGLSKLKHGEAKK